MNIPIYIFKSATIGLPNQTGIEIDDVGHGLNRATIIKRHNLDQCKTSSIYIFKGSHGLEFRYVGSKSNKLSITIAKQSSDKNDYQIYTMSSAGCTLHQHKRLTNVVDTWLNWSVRNICPSIQYSN